jgi:uncharacterized membrane protein
MVIIPGQRKVMAQMQAGQPVDPVHGQRAKQRSVHNTYFTLPVLVAMLSNHYGMLYQGRHNWLVLVLLMLAGVLIRQFFLLRHRGAIHWGWWAAGIAVILAVIVWLAPSSAPTPTRAATDPVAAQGKVEFAQLKTVLDQRCVVCHGEAVAQKSVRVDSPAAVAAHAQQIYQQVVVLKLMPLGNATQITQEERGLVGRWFTEGAKVGP